MVFGPLHGRRDCCVHLGGVPLPLVQQHRYLSFLPLGALTSTFFVFEGIVFFTKHWLGALVKLSFSFLSSVFVVNVLATKMFKT